MKRFLTFALALLILVVPVKISKAQTTILPYQSAPLCQFHDPLAFHTLWNDELGCHYDHVHGDNPHTVDYIFGTDYLNETGGEIQMPWQPAGVNQIDTDRKHDGLFWLVRDHSNDPVSCYSVNTNGCVKAFRAETHAITDIHDSIRRTNGVYSGSFHVYRLEALVCLVDNPNDCGIVRMSGRQYLGDLVYSSSDANGRLVITTLFDVDEPRDIWGNNTAHPQSLHHTFARRSSSWYPVSPRGLTRISTTFGDVFDYVDPTDPWTLNLETDKNQSYFKPEIIGINVNSPWLRNIFVNVGGHINFTGFVDNTDLPVTICPNVCTPISLENVPYAAYTYRNSEYREYDVYFGRNSSGWIEYPGAPQ